MTLAVALAVAHNPVWDTAILHGDEGLWLPNALPAKRLADRHGFVVQDDWAAHVRQASVRFNSGGSGSLVSARGLVMTNHHVGADAIQKLSSGQRNLYRDGFYAKSADLELPTPDLEVNVLESITDVTARVVGAVTPQMTPAEAFAARRAITAEIEKQSLDATGLRSDVVTLYQGGAYHLYRYKKYTDVRLVFAPEFTAAFFGGDPDNFEYPRYCLDVAFFRVYENGQPAVTPHYFTWSANGAAEGELVFVSGHPGRTNRQNTIAQLVYQRDFALPRSLDVLRRREVMLQGFASRSPENARIAQEDLFGIQNSRKALLGKLGGLQDPALFATKVAEENAIRAAVAADAKLTAEFADAWDTVAATQNIRRQRLYPLMGLLERGTAFNSELFAIARTLVRLAAEKPKPNGERLREYRESALASLELQLFSTAPIYPALEKARLADSLAMLAETLGGDHPLVGKVLAGRSPPDRAAQLIDASKLADVAVRKTLAAGGAAAIAASDDPLIQLAVAIDPEARAVRAIEETECDGPERTAFDKIARARFATLGTDTYPDATFTLRLSYGVVRGYTQAGQAVPAFTTMAGAFDREQLFAARDPFALPALWHKQRNAFDGRTPYNFVCTADIIGGNSGSPVINARAEIVGLIFDGNIQSLVWDYIFTDTEARAVAVDSRGIMEALTKIYGADALAAELRAPATPKTAK